MKDNTWSNIVYTLLADEPSLLHEIGNQLEQTYSREVDLCPIKLMKIILYLCEDNNKADDNIGDNKHNDNSEYVHSDENSEHDDNQYNFDDNSEYNNDNQYNSEDDTDNNQYNSNNSSVNNNTSYQYDDYSNSDDIDDESEN